MSIKIQFGYVFSIFKEQLTNNHSYMIEKKCLIVLLFSKVKMYYQILQYQYRKYYAIKTKDVTFAVVGTITFRVIKNFFIQKSYHKFHSTFDLS